MEYDVAISRIEKKEFEYLLKYDQLKSEMKAKKVFEGFFEGEITFPPTYKFDPGTDTYDTSEKKRIPAYCDRILIKAKNPEDFKLEFYKSEPNYYISDHKPVVALFNVKCEKIDQEKLLEVTNEIFDKI